MSDPDLIMDLGLSRRRYESLDPYERFVWADRLLAYCIFPHDRPPFIDGAVERESYLVCKSAYRLQFLKHMGPSFAIPRHLHRLSYKNRERYLREERAFYNSRGGDRDLIWSYGLEIYQQYEAIFKTQAILVSAMASNLIKMNNTPNLTSPRSLSKAIATVIGDLPQKSGLNKKTIDNQASLKRQSNLSWRKALVPLGRPIIAVPKFESEALREVWDRYKPVLPYVIAYGLNVLSREKAKSDSTPWSGNAFYDRPERIFEDIFCFEKFLTENKGSQSKNLMLAPEVLWRFMPGFSPSVKPTSVGSFGTLQGGALKIAERH